MSLAAVSSSEIRAAFRSIMLDHGAKFAVDAVRRSLDADRHQYVAALHYDVDTDRYHVHLAVNEVLLDGRAPDRLQDYAKLARAADWFERELGL